MGILYRENNNTSCPNLPVITFKKVGRLGNQLSSYVNMLVLERSFYIKAFLPEKIKNHLQAFFSNVSMPVLDSISHCNMKFEKIQSFSNFANKNSVCYSKKRESEVNL